MIEPEQGPGHMGMLANQVPKAAITELRGLISCRCDKCLSRAIAATLNAWTGRHFIGNIGVYLPLPQENSDAE